MIQTLCFNLLNWLNIAVAGMKKIPGSTKTWKGEIKTQPIWEEVDEAAGRAVGKRYKRKISQGKALLVDE